MSSLFGPVEPVPSERIRILADGDRVLLGDRALDVLDTPGHASHHVALVDSATGAVFTGDALRAEVPRPRAPRPRRPGPAPRHPLHLRNLISASSGVPSNAPSGAVTCGIFLPLRSGR